MMIRMTMKTGKLMIMLQSGIRENTITTSSKIVISFKITTSSKCSGKWRNKETGLLLLEVATKQSTAKRQLNIDHCWTPSMVSCLSLWLPVLYRVNKKITLISIFWPDFSEIFRGHTKSHHVVSGRWAMAIRCMHGHFRLEQLTLIWKRSLNWTLNCSFCTVAANYIHEDC